eukprot:m.308600 g.308600  ORF g.308600 m.308600 type:complete len:225 (-) comp55330_c0_seq6:733-1407(-)
MAQERSWKLVMLGDSGVGKTAFVQRAAHDRFTLPCTTLSCSFDHKVVTTPSFRVKVQPFEDSCDLFTLEAEGFRLPLLYSFQFQLWDTAGQERYRVLSRMYTRNAEIAVLMYDVHRPATFDGMQRWFREAQPHIASNCVFAVIAHKMDHADTAPTVPRASGALFAESIGGLFMEASALTARGVQEAFVAIAAEVHCRAIFPLQPAPAPPPAPSGSSWASVCCIS